MPYAGAVCRITIRMTQMEDKSMNFGESIDFQYYIRPTAIQHTAASKNLTWIQIQACSENCSSTQKRRKRVSGVEHVPALHRA
jgi:hypothetical protein